MSDDDFVLHVTGGAAAHQTRESSSRRRKTTTTSKTPAPEEKSEESRPASRRHPSRSSAKTYSAFHMSAAELSRPRRAAQQVVVPAANDESSSSSSDDVDVRAGRFEAVGYSLRLSRAVARGLGLARPTTVQVVAARTLREHANALLVAPTGSGKTLAYLLPVLDAIGARPRTSRADGTLAVAVAPTRELCQQIAAVATKLARSFEVSIVPGAICGGERRKSEKARLRKGLGLVAATPGRLVDHLKTTACFKTDNLEWLVLDEVDRLLDLGFGPQIMDIAGRLIPPSTPRRRRPQENQRKKIRTVLVTASLDSRLAQLATRQLGRDHAVADCSTLLTTSSSSPPPSSESSFFVIAVPPALRLEYAVVTLKSRLAALGALLASRPTAKTLVFVSCCASAEFHARLARAAGLGGRRAAIGSLHGNMERASRALAYDAFCASPEPGAVLFATDLAARGLDFDGANVDWVLHLDPPRDVATFVHRSGRAARAGRPGRATLCLLPTEAKGLLDAITHRGVTLPARVPVPADHLGDDDAVHAEWRRLRDAVKDGSADDPDLLDAARLAFTTHLKAYASKADSKSVASPAERAALDDAFQLRRLHLGHAAKAFALDDPPSRVNKRHPQSSSHKRSLASSSPGRRRRPPSDRNDDPDALPAADPASARKRPRVLRSAAASRPRARSVGSTSRTLAAAKASSASDEFFGL